VTGVIGYGARCPLLPTRVLLTMSPPSGGGCTAGASGAWSPDTVLPATLAASDAWHAAVLGTASVNAGSIGKLLLLRLHRHTRTLALRPLCIALLAMAARLQLLHVV
jgi:hypothetical protein